MHNRVIMVPEPSLYMIFLKLFAGRILEVERHRGHHGVMEPASKGKEERKQMNSSSFFWTPCPAPVRSFTDNIFSVICSSFQDFLLCSL